MTGRPRALTPEQVKEIIESRKPSGVLARRYNVTRQTIYNTIKRAQEEGQKPWEHTAD